MEAPHEHGIVSRKTIAFFDREGQTTDWSWLACVEHSLNSHLAIMLMRDQITRRAVIAGGLGSGILLLGPRGVWSAPTDSPIGVDPSAYFAHAKRLAEALRSLGAGLTAEHERQMGFLSATPATAQVIEADRILDQYTLMHVRLDDRGLGQSVVAGNAKRELVEQGWRVFLVRVENPFGKRGAVRFESPSAMPEGELRASVHYGSDTPTRRLMAQPIDVARSWMGYQFFTNKPLQPELSGLGIEYRIIQLYSRDRGRKSIHVRTYSADAPLISVYARESKQLAVTFDCLPSSNVDLGIKDWDGAGTTASLIIRDRVGRLYPAPAHRLEPDLGFHPQVYRADGESVRLPAGDYTITAWRGPEYVRKSRSFTVDDRDASPRLAVQLERWINAAALGWYPGDTHLHAETSNYGNIPTASMGTTPETMVRHVRGEALAVGSVLMWRQGYYYQKQFLTGRVYQPTGVLPHSALQEASNTSLQPRATPHDDDSLIRYDVEQAGFPSDHSGHPVLLRLRNHDYPGVRNLDDWPSWNLPVLKWAKAQGAIVGYAHCGLGFAVNARELPNYELPPLDSVGANEYLVDVTHDAVDFVSEGEIHPVAGLNFWYHILNCGFRTPMIGETDFPAFSAERAGTVRTYVGLGQAPRGDAGFDSWVEGIKRGRVYFGDGRSHFIDFRIDNHGLGQDGPALSKPRRVSVTARIAARLEEIPTPADEDHNTPIYSYWHLERARIGVTRTVPLEIVVNGKPVARHEVLADGTLRDFSAQIELQQSAWIALRILPSGHTAPVFATVAGRPIRVSRRSAQWCLDCIDVLWKEKAHLIRPSEREQARAAYDHAREVYRRVRSECSHE